MACITLLLPPTWVEYAQIDQPIKLSRVPHMITVLHNK